MRFMKTLISFFGLLTASFLLISCGGSGEGGGWRGYAPSRQIYDSGYSHGWGGSLLLLKPMPRIRWYAIRMWMEWLAFGRTTPRRAWKLSKLLTMMR